MGIAPVFWDFLLGIHKKFPRKKNKLGVDSHIISSKYNQAKDKKMSGKQDNDKVNELQREIKAEQAKIVAKPLSPLQELLASTYLYSAVMSMSICTVTAALAESGLDSLYLGAGGVAMIASSYKEFLDVSKAGIKSWDLNKFMHLGFQSISVALLAQLALSKIAGNSSLNRSRLFSGGLLSAIVFGASYYYTKRVRGVYHFGPAMAGAFFGVASTYVLGNTASLLDRNGVKNMFGSKAVMSSMYFLKYVGSC